MSDLVAQKVQYRGTADIFIDNVSGVEFEKDGEPQEVTAERGEFLKSLPGHDFAVVASVSAPTPSAPAPSGDGSGPKGGSR